MSNYVCFLITVLYQDHGFLLQCALKVDRDRLSDDCCEFPMEPENKEKIHSLLPLHVRNCGPIVEIKEIFEVEVK